MFSLPSQVYNWTTDRFVPYDARIDNTRSASRLTVFTNAGYLKVAIAFFQDSASGRFRTQSPIYKWETASFSLLQEIGSNGAVDVEYFEFAGNQYLVFANSKSTVDVFQWNSLQFSSSPVQSIAISSVQTAKPYTIDGNGKKLTDTFCLTSILNFINLWDLLEVQIKDVLPTNRKVNFKSS